MKSQLEKIEGKNKRRRTESEDRQVNAHIYATLPQRAQNGALVFSFVSLLSLY